MASDLDALDNASSSSAEDLLNISFNNITHIVRNGILFKGRKTILNKLSGQFNAGELTVIMGQSGAGKSSLMDILTGHTKPTSGEIYVNGSIRNEKMFRRRSCYILQDDKIQDQLTVRESLQIAAELKMGNHINSKQKNDRIVQLITALKLSMCQDTRAVSLSGGQKKRLAIGLELISDPQVMFLDEPTSGLDCSNANQLFRLLRELAHQGRTVVVTIHQPSASLLEKVDRVYAMVGGQCAYMGSVPQLRPYLERLGVTCPEYHNPVDLLIEICDEADKKARLVVNSENGLSMSWITDVTDRRSIDNSKNGCRNEEVFLTSLPPPKENPTNKVLLAIKSTYSTSRWNQFLTLTKRSLMSTWRDPTFLLMYSGIHVGMALCIGIIFYNIGGVANNIPTNFNFLYFCLMFLMFTAFSSVSISFPEQIHIVRREHFNRWYSTSAYYASTLASILPTQTACTCLYVVITYWMTGQPREMTRFFMYMSTLLMVSIASICVGLLNGSIFNVQNGVIFGPFFIMPFTVFSGFFLRLSDASSFFTWFFHISFLKHGLDGVMISIYGMGRPRLPCIDEIDKTVTYCHYTYPKQFLTERDMQNIDILVVYGALVGTFVVAITLSYSILRVRLKHKW